MINITLVGEQTQVIRHGDITGDGLPDIIKNANVGNFYILYFAMVSPGVFGPPVSVDPTFPGYPGCIDTGDLNSNGIVDIVASVQYGSVYVLMTTVVGLAPPTFARTLLLPLCVADSNYHQVLSLGDFDGDTLPDLVVSDGYSHLTMRNIAGIISGAMVRVVNSVAMTYWLNTGDTDNDGDTDWVSNIFLPVGTGIAVGINTDGLGTFTNTTIAQGLGGFGQDMFIRDLDTDGLNDVLWQTWSNPGCFWARRTGASTYQPKALALATSPGGQIYACTVGDFDGDRDMDVALTSYTEAFVYSENKDTFGPRTWPTISPTFFMRLSVGHLHSFDMDMDGDDDILIAHSSHGVRGYISSGYSITVGQIAPLVAAPFAAAPAAALSVVAELTGDNAVDLLFGNPSTGGLAILRTSPGVGLSSWITAPNATIALARRGTASALTGLRSVSAADFDRLDGDDDVLSLSAVGVTLFVHGGSGATAADWTMSTLLVPASAATAAGLLCRGHTDFNADLWPDVLWVDTAGAALWGAANLRDGTAAAATQLATNAAFAGATSCVGLALSAAAGAAPSVLVAGVTGGIVVVHLSAGGGAETVLSAAGATGMVAMAVCDVSGDGVADVITATATSVQTALGARSLPTGAFGAFSALAATAGGALATPAALGCGDRDGDSRPDVAVIFAHSGVWFRGLNASASAGGIIGTVDGWLPSAPGVTALGCAIIDGDQNGAPDIAVLGSNGTVLTIMSRELGPLVSSLAVRTIATPTWECGLTAACLRQALAMLPTNVPLLVLTTGTVYRLEIPDGAYGGCFAAPYDSTLAVVTVTGSATTAAGRATFMCGADAGGVMFSVTGGRSLTVNNFAIIGGGVGTAAYSIGGVAVTATGLGTVLSITNCVFANCTNTRASTLSASFFDGIGSAVLANTGARLTLSKSQFTGNLARLHGGAVGAIDLQSLTVADCVFMSNSAGGHGGALYVVRSQSSVVIVSTATVRGASVFAFNRAGSTHAGGALALFGPSLSANLTGTVLRSNSAAWGGALAASAAAFPDIGLASAAQVTPSFTTNGAGGAFQSATLADVTIDSNRANYGGVVYACESSVVFGGTSLAITANDATSGGALVFACALRFRMTGGMVSDLTLLRGAVGLGPWVSAVTVPASVALLAGPATVAGAGGASSAYGTTAGVAFPPQSATWVRRNANLTAVSPGTTLNEGAGLGLAVFDPLGSVVTDALLSVELTVSVRALGNGTAGYTLSGARSGTLSGSPLYFPQSSLVVQMAVAATRAVSSNGSGADGFGTVRFGATVQGVVYPFPLAGSDLEVSACGEGQGRVEAVGAATFTCSACADLTYNSRASTRESCLACPAGAVSTGPGAVQCAYCAANADRLLDSTGASFCQCHAGYFSEEPSNNLAPCNACPRRQSCLRGSVCAPGHDPASQLCSRCKIGFYSDSSGLCQKCPQAKKPLLGVFVAFLLACGIGVGLIASFTIYRLHRNKAKNEAALEAAKTSRRATYVRSSERRKALLVHTVSMAVLFLQIMGFLGTANWRWPDSSRRVLQSFSVLSLDLSIFASECTLTSFYLKFALSVTFPLAGLAAALATNGLVGLLNRCRGGAGLQAASLSGLLMVTFTRAGPVLYLPLARSTLLFFDCTKLPDGLYYLDVDLGIRCFDAKWMRYLPLAVFALGVWVLGLPLLLSMVLARNRRSLFSDPDVFSRYGSIYRVYRHSYVAGEILQLLKRLAIICVLLFFSRNQPVQFSALLALFFGFTVWHAKYPMYFEPVYNTLELRFNFAITLVVHFGMVFATSTFPTELTRKAFEVLSLAAIVACLVTLLASGLSELQQWRRRKVDKNALDRLDDEEEMHEDKHLEDGHRPMLVEGTFSAALVQQFNVEARDLDATEWARVRDALLIQSQSHVSEDEGDGEDYDEDDGGELVDSSTLSVSIEASESFGGPHDGPGIRSHQVEASSGAASGSDESSRRASFDGSESQGGLSHDASLSQGMSHGLSQGGLSQGSSDASGDVSGDAESAAPSSDHSVGSGSSHSEGPAEGGSAVESATRSAASSLQSRDSSHASDTLESQQ